MYNILLLILFVLVSNIHHSSRRQSMSMKLVKKSFMKLPQKSYEYEIYGFTDNSSFIYIIISMQIEFIQYNLLIETYV